MSSIGWLHLADFHQGAGGSVALRQPPGKALLDDLARMHERSGPWQLVIVAGDLTFSGAREEFDAVEEVLDALLSHVGELNGGDGAPLLFCVPGNHDIVRPDPSSSVVRALRRWQEDPTVREEFWNEPESPYRRVVERAFEPYRRAWTRFRARWSAGPGVAYREGLLPGDFTATIDLGGHRIGVAGLSSAFLQVAAYAHEERLELEPRQLRAACGGDVSAWITRHDAALLVTHTPSGWLAPSAHERYRAEINPEGRFLAHLSAHAHDTSAVVHRELGSRAAGLEVECPSLFGLDQWEDRLGHPAPRRRGYHAARVTIDRMNAEAVVEIWPRVAELDRADRPRFGPAARLAPLDERGAWAGKIALLGRAEDLARRGTGRAFEVWSPSGSSDDEAEQSPLLERIALRDALAARYDARDARRLAAEAGIDVAHTGAGGAAIDVWHVVVEDASRRGRLADLVEIVRLEYPRDARIAVAWERYLSSVSPRSRREASGPVSVDTVGDERPEQIYDRLVRLAPAEWDAVLFHLAPLPDTVPGPEAPLGSRAMALVRDAQRGGRAGLDRLAYALSRVTGASSRDFVRRGRVSDFKPTPQSLERLLLAVFPRESDLDAFCFRELPQVYRQFTHAMGRRERTRLLLDRTDPNELIDKLRRAAPSAWAELRNEVTYE